ncbi:hypothetical protein SPURM210S_08276 [Streptomyces purpurascens]|nr:hypothetical protein [Streptomyces purpurascens]
MIGDKSYFGRDFERELAEHGIRLLRPTCEEEGGASHQTNIA